MKSACRKVLAFASPFCATLLVLTSLVLLGNCAEAQDTKADKPVAANKTEATSEGKAAEKMWEDFDANNFGNPTQIDNKWMPMKPGMRYTYEGTTVEDDGTVVPHKVVINVTDMTKVIGGVRSLVTWDLDYGDGELVEAELAFFAQDNDGNVWRMGEYPEEYDEGKFIAAPAWIHGYEEARAGVMMKGSPQLGTSSYAQGWGPAVGWTDRGQVDQMGVETKVPAGQYKDVLVVAETSASEPDAQQLKYYAPDVGNVYVGWRGAGEKTKEVLELAKVEQLDAKGMDEVRAAALKMEKDAYQRSPNVYGPTKPLEKLGAATATK